MIDYIFAILLLGFVLIAIELRKSYHALPKKELKYRASHGDALAEKLYRAATYDTTLDIFLWLVIILSAAGSLVLFNRLAPAWLSFIAVVLLLWIAFAWLPKAKVSKLTVKLVVMITPLVATILNYFHPLAHRASRLNKAHSSKVVHTGVYDKAGLIELIDQQKTQPDNRINDQDLEIMARSIDLPATKVADVCLPWSKVKTIMPNDPVGPILLDELHKSQQHLVPVTSDKASKELIGILNLSKLDISSKGLVSDHMDTTVYYLNEEDSLDYALKSFAVTNYPLFIVVDDKRNLRGVLTFNDIVEQLVGHIPGEDYEQFASIDAVADKYKQTE